MNERTTRRLPRTPEFAAAEDAGADRWVPACGGREEPFQHKGTRWLYVYNPALGEHAYLNLDQDLVVEDYHDWS